MTNSREFMKEVEIILEEAEEALEKGKWIVNLVKDFLKKRSE